MKTTPAASPPIAALLVLGGTLLLLSSSRREESSSSLLEEVWEESMSWLQRVIRRIQQHEGHYDSLNRNLDGAGLSFGIMQWSQRTGQLGVLLSEFYAADAQAFQRIFGSHYATLLEVTKQGQLAPVHGHVLWQSPWIERFIAAGQYKRFQEVQDTLAKNGVHMTAARRCAHVLGVKTERAMALYFDRCIQQGQNGVPVIAQQVASRLSGQTHPTKTILLAFAQACADRFRTVSDPHSEWYSQQRNLKWRQVGAEWHVFAGTIDLFADVTRRCRSILEDQELSDAPLESV
jgi:hypothetical protein